MRQRRRGGWSMLEVMISLIILGIFVSLTMPRFDRALEQTRLDIAAANLRAIWAAERLYWLENRGYCNSLDTLVTLGFLDASVTRSASTYSYAIPSADAASFAATSIRTGNSTWFGSLQIDQTGVVTGSIKTYSEAALTPGFQ